MPFGVNLAPRVFTKIMRKIMKEIRSRWKLKSIQYADDILLMSKDKEELERKTIEIILWMRSLGWIIQEKKCRLKGDQKFIFLGW
jgi:hypothetical protein